MPVRVIQLLVRFANCLLVFTLVGKFISAHKAFAKPGSNPRGPAAVTEEVHVGMSYRATIPHLLGLLILWLCCVLFSNGKCYEE